MRINTLHILPALLALIALGSCTPEPDGLSPKQDGIALHIFVKDLQTKTTRDGNSARNENLISSAVDLFFYDEQDHEITKEVIGAVLNSGWVYIQTNPNDIETIFGTRAAGAHCGLLVVANFPGADHDASDYAGTPGSRTLEDIQGTVLSAANWSLLPQSSFVMTGTAQLTLGNAQGSTPVVEYNIGLERVAAKVTFDLTVADNITSNGSSWVPQLGNMSVYLVNAMRKATVGATTEPVPLSDDVTFGSPAETILYPQYAGRTLHPTGETRTRTHTIDGVTTTSTLNVYSPDNGSEQPFYTYPSSWSTGAPMEPYLKLIINWTHGTTTKPYYYKIPFSGNALERNHWYHISIDVWILGTEQVDPPSIEIHYAIADWSGEMDTSEDENFTSATSVAASVITVRYLTVPTTEYVRMRSLFPDPPPLQPRSSPPATSTSRPPSSCSSTRTISPSPSSPATTWR